MSLISIGVIGTGGMGARHVHNLHTHVAGARVASVYDLDQARAVDVAAAAGGATVARDPLALITDPAVEAVIIASPDPTHADLAAACVQQGKPVLCEKPLATTAPRAREVVELEIAKGRRLISLGFMRRFDPAHTAVKRALDAGRIGRPILFKGTSRAAMMAPDLPIATIMSNSAIHDMDSARWIMGRDVQDVYVRAVRTHDHFAPGARDLFLITATLEGDCIVSIECSMATEYGYDIEATVVGEKGVLETIQPDVAILRSKGMRGYAYQRDWLERFERAYLVELEEWVTSLRAGRNFAGASAWDGYMASLMADACTEAVATGKVTPVATPVRPDLYR